MPARQLDPSRRALLVKSAKLFALAALAADVGRIRPAAAKAAKGDFMYQDHQHDGKSCSECKFFSPDRQSPGIGSCSVVAGVISRDGWCEAFSPKVVA
ncbi:MAG TPA: high-potential iron-sulfur protein [Casimicrobiaceae bacterium]|nr:high-potential iron-sulfur protein [Casimicrobiaceae bacterium]